jgi:hypothetical protein
MNARESTACGEGALPLSAALKITGSVDAQCKKMLALATELQRCLNLMNETCTDHGPTAHVAQLNYRLVRTAQNLLADVGVEILSGNAEEAMKDLAALSMFMMFCGHSSDLFAYTLCEGRSCSGHFEHLKKRIVKMFDDMKAGVYEAALQPLKEDDDGAQQVKN